MSLNRKNLCITSHCRNRFRERTPYFQTAEQDYNALCALNKGYKLASFRFGSDFYEFIRAKQLDNGIYTVRVWNDFIYVFKNNTGKTAYYVLCTVYPVPECFLPISSYICTVNNQCFISVNGTHFVSERYASGLCEDVEDAIIFKSEESAMNFIKNNRNLAGLNCDIVIL